MEACYKATQDHLNEIAEKSPLFKKTKENHDAYMKEVIFYTQIQKNITTTTCSAKCARDELSLEHDPESVQRFFRKDHAQTKT